MDNIYNFFFYLVAKVSHKINKQDKDFAFTAVVFVSLCMILNMLALSLLILNNNINSVRPRVLGILISLPLIGLNWYFLMSNGKSEKIMNYYNEKFENKNYNKLTIFLIVFYICFSLSSAIYIAFLVRNHIL